MTVSTARTPARALIADADAPHAQTVLIGKLLQSNWELGSGLCPQLLSIAE
jgi:hypothetical protein